MFEIIIFTIVVLVVTSILIGVLHASRDKVESTVYKVSDDATPSIMQVRQQYLNNRK